ncbi:MAG: hypothetical protein LKF36_09065 [Lactobacillus sp.]|nr:hypothetical protein [Lactobacillus sp.]
MELNESAQTALAAILNQNPWKLFWPTDPLVILDEAGKQATIVTFERQDDTTMIQFFDTPGGIESFLIQQTTGFELWEPSKLYEDYLGITSNKTQLTIKKHYQGQEQVATTADITLLNAILPQLNQMLADLPSDAKLQSNLKKDKYPTRAYKDGKWYTRFRALRIPRQQGLFPTVKPTTFKPFQNSPVEAVNLEVVVTYLSHQVVDKSGASFYPRLLLVVDHTSGGILVQDIIDPKQTVTEALGTWLKGFIKASGRPAHLYTHYGEAQRLKDVAKLLDISLTTEVPLIYTGQLYDALKKELADNDK